MTTNFEKIKAMDIEEMAKILSSDCANRCPKYFQFKVSNLLEENKMLDNAGGRQYINELALLGLERINTILKSMYEYN